MRLRVVLLAAVMLSAGLPAAGLAPDTGDASTTNDDHTPADPLDEAEIVRDEHGVAHIYTNSERALWYANGYVQAQDRLWAMDLLRHLSYGEGASVVGPGGGILEMDLDTRNSLYNESNLQEQYENADPEFKKAIDSYTDGVNRAASEMQATGEMPAEFPLLQHAFEPWEAVDTVAVATFLLARFGNGGGAEIANAQLYEKLENQLGQAQAPEAFADLNWGEREDTYTTIQEETYTEFDPHADTKPFDAMPAEQKEAARAAMGAESFGTEAKRPGPASQIPLTAQQSVPDVGFFQGEDIGPEDFRLGSNALLIAPSLSETDQALLGGGPQMGYFNPQVPYEVGLHYDAEDPDEDYEAEGMGVTGAPGVIIGRTDDFAVTVTSGISDQTDTIALEATGERSYEWTDANGDTVERDLDCRTERHRIFSPPAIWGPATAEEPTNPSPPVDVVEQEVCRADLSAVGEPAEVTYPVTEITRDEDGDPQWFFAKKTSSRMEEVDSAIKWLTLLEADNFDEFEDHFEGFAFTFNFHYAGVKEDTDSGQAACYVHVGKQPVRVDELDPRFPTPSGDAWLWGPGEKPEVRNGDELPRICNPDKGYLAQWNNKPQEGWSSGDSRELWGSIHRVERLDQEVRETTQPNGDGTVDNKLNLDEVQTILEQAATEDSLANQIVPLLLQNYANKVPDGAETALASWAEGGADTDYPWRAGTNTTAPDDAEVSNASDDDYTEENSDLVYVDRGHTVYDKVVPELLNQVFADELGDHLRGVNLDPRNSGDPHAGDHGQHNNPFAILVDALEGQTTRNWCDEVDTPATESCSQQVAEAFAAVELDGVAADEIGYTDQHKSPFTSLGVGPSYQIPMTNRATFYHFHAGSDVSQSFATLPPGATGHMSVADFVRFTLTGEEPEHMDDQLDDYVDFQPKKIAWTSQEASQNADSAGPLIVPPGLG